MTILYLYNKIGKNWEHNRDINFSFVFCLFFFVEIISEANIDIGHNFSIKKNIESIDNKTPHLIY